MFYHVNRNYAEFEKRRLRFIIHCNFKLYAFILSTLAQIFCYAFGGQSILWANLAASHCKLIYISG